MDDRRKDPAAPLRGDPVTLREITRENLIDVLRLRVAAEQESLVADNGASIAQGCYHDEAWFRAIYAGETAVGFVMLSEKPEVPEYYVWRLMIGERFQRMGFGRRAMELVIDRVRGLPDARELLLGVLPKDGNALAFYAGLGFEDTGRVEDGEVVLRLAL